MSNLNPSNGLSQVHDFGKQTDNKHKDRQIKLQEMHGNRRNRLRCKSDFV